MTNSEYKQLCLIHDSLLNGQNTQMVKQIEIYGEYDFFSDYREFLIGNTLSEDNNSLSATRHVFDAFSDCVISYFKIKNR